MTRNRGGWSLAILAALVAGCSTTPPQPPSGVDPKQPEVEIALKFVVVDDPPLAAAIRREWKARSKTPLDVLEASWKAGLPTDAPSGDALIYPVARLGELAEKGWIAPLPDASLRALDAERDDLAPFLLQTECKWGGATWAVPFGSQGLVLYARADLLHAIGLAPPTTWEEYAVIVRRLKASAWGKEAGQIVAAEPLADGWRGLLLLARSAPYLRHRGNYSTYFDFSSMEPLVASPAMVQGLEELAAVQAATDDATQSLTPEACVELFWSGKAALAIGLPRRSGEERREVKVSPEQVLLSSLPGSTRVFNPSDQAWEARAEDEPQRVPLVAVSGRIGSLLAGSPHKIAAAQALLLISGKEWSPAIAPESTATGPFRRSHLEQFGRWQESGADPRLSRDLADLLAARFDAKLGLLPPTLPGGPRYLAALDEAVQATIRGKSPPAAALAQAADAWRAITKELGLATQKSAYRRSLGLKE